MLTKPATHPAWAKARGVLTRRGVCRISIARQYGIGWAGFHQHRRRNKRDRADSPKDVGFQIHSDLLSGACLADVV